MNLGCTNYYWYSSPIGKITIAQYEDAVSYIGFGCCALQGKRSSSVLTNTVANQLQEFLAGKRRVFEVPLYIQGSEFQKTVWEEVRRIPYGQTRSYAQVAAAIGNAKATRAVGMANNKNPLPILIPCHRVIGANGKPVGYAGGLKLKEFLLELERVHSTTRM